MYLKLLNRTNASDYKNLNIEQIINVYASADSTMAIVNTTEEVSPIDEITKIEETEFNTLKDSWEKERALLIVVTSQPSEAEILQKQLLETQALVANLQEQILLNK